jgi:ADP-dependent NAD(P)H-hydrate dehydratase
VRRVDAPGDAREIDDAVLADIGRPVDGDGGDKFDRGQAIVVGGDLETPGGAVLAALAALRIGAGRARLVTDASMAPLIAAATPELRVTPLPGSASAPDLAASGALANAIGAADAVLVGSGCSDRATASRLLEQVLPLLGPRARLLIDASALPVVADRPGLLDEIGSRAILLPNPGEAAHLLDRDREAVEREPGRAVLDAVERFGATVAVRGQTTWIADPRAGPFVERGGHATLGTSGSGDVLAGMVLGLAARGAPALSALSWAVHAHCRCGQVLAGRDGGIGMIARELLDLIPRSFNELLRR